MFAAMFSKDDDFSQGKKKSIIDSLEQTPATNSTYLGYFMSPHGLEGLKGSNMKQVYAVSSASMSSEAALHSGPESPSFHQESDSSLPSWERE